MNRTIEKYALALSIGNTTIYAVLLVIAVV